MTEQLNSPNNLVLGFATRLPPSAYIRFIGTLRQSGYRGAVLLVVSAHDLSTQVRECFEAFQVTFVTVDDSPLPAVTYRFFVYQQILQNAMFLNPRSRVMLTDVRDVIFQRDPFCHPAVARHELCCALETRRIRECGYNSQWIAGAFGLQVYEALRDEFIICAGTTIGTLDIIKRYIGLQCEFALGREERREGHGKKLSGSVPNDQGIHNYLLRLGEWDGTSVCLSDNSEGLFLTLGYDSARISEKGEFCTVHGGPACVVHQFDRLHHSVLLGLTPLVGYPLNDTIESAARVAGHSAAA